MEPECDEQCDAREFLTQLKNEWDFPKSAQLESGAEMSPEDEVLEDKVQRQIRWLESEASRPASRRLPKDAAPPREVLSCAMNLVLMDRPPPLNDSKFGYHLQVVRYLEERSRMMGVGFSLISADSGDSFQVAMLPWKRGMGTWPPENWAFLLAASIKRFGWQPLTTISASYKLQDCPVDDFEMRVYESYVDIIRGDRYKGMDSSAKTLSGLFGRFINFEQTNDLALCFDARLWRVACDLGLGVEDYSLRPALTYHMGMDNAEMVVEGGSDRRQWDGVEEYVQWRLSSANIHPDLTDAEAEKHRQFLWEVLQTQRMRNTNHTDSAVDCWNLYKEFAEKKLGKKLRRIAKKYDMPIPALATKHVRLRCDYCKKAEGEVVGDNGKPGAKLRTCPCNPDGHPYYCNSACQKADWPFHSEFCTVSRQKSKKKKKKKKTKQNNELS